MGVGFGTEVGDGVVDCVERCVFAWVVLVIDIGLREMCMGIWAVPRNMTSDSLPVPVLTKYLTSMPSSIDEILNVEANPDPP